MSKPEGHAALMDAVYRRQRHIYDATRKYFLLGRDGLIADLAPAKGDRVLEVGCGTGRNLVMAARRYPGVDFYGIDISAEMLATARGNLGRFAKRVTLAEGDATDFDAFNLFGVEGFERVYFSYTLSMVPDWPAALRSALEATLPEGRLLAVDFGQQERLPGFARRGLRGFLAQFHVDPQAEMAEGFAAAAKADGRPLTFRSLYRDYAWSFSVGPKDETAG